MSVPSERGGKQPKNLPPPPARHSSFIHGPKPFLPYSYLHSKPRPPPLVRRALGAFLLMYKCVDDNDNDKSPVGNKTPFANPDRTSLDLAYYSILQLVRDDQYPKYMDYILVQRQLRVSRLEAQWWKNVREGFVEQRGWFLGVLRIVKALFRNRHPYGSCGS